MGLHIEVYSKLQKLDDSQVELNEDGTPVNDMVISCYSNPEFPAHIAGISDYSFYLCEGEVLKFDAGTYTNYSRWRNWLAQVGGFEDAIEVWKKGGVGAFVELINFSDSEGTIGFYVASKLSKDFDEMEAYAQIMSYDNPYWFELYQNWKKSCELAAQGGAILFR